ncbi:NADP-dependent aldehyde dehydrogenase [Saccharopolyspora erythraea NRRL 2338]|uniref:2,5-dioxovalerate dehydrogenase n=2 Tax=Saccharopolyspora erythraea TaxID=1836 RepID=A4F6L8_SACEN|nr:aldehyde dehydrogenase (NADP(+)) [Saccharopolyspora erythraea]EQD87245.1 2,5-dioxovalerate dehydrogenase [Saccharopolyspora erythraea D]PFG93495.1 NADP-dependent aldehyde dehydrogenase [Saccharopolyspora erythraea NRRL 2338]QRK90357.1 aldehyde dehydrogenase (NADP(+)) [Saccharopolyspora erythraea]CAL99692.1 aldehyde dehydrogenase (NAD+) [Saccharopolyspora erythraea NRRL 2338]
MPTGNMIIAGTPVFGGGKRVRAVDPSTGAELEPEFGHGGAAEVEQACAAAHEAFAVYRETGGEQRARLLEAIADGIEAIGPALVDRAHAETGLPTARLTGERARTTGQLRLFAEVAREGSWAGARIDPALPDRTPLPRADIRQRKVALGPVAVFGSSNFPLAFSVAGGDTASALAAGCPVVVKAHDAHPGTSEMVGRAVAQAVAACGLPAGTFSLLFGSGPGLGTALVTDPRIQAVGFTGSRSGGLALAAAAAARPRPIPVHAEMSSVNPVFLLPGALAERAGQLGAEFAGSLTLGSGQFCTNPGLVIAVDGPGLDAFLESAAEAVARTEPTTMLTPGIASAYDEGVSALAAQEPVSVLARGRESAQPNGCRAALLSTSAKSFLDSDALQQEVFGSCSLVVRCADVAQVLAVAEALEGQLTATVHATEQDHEQVADLLPVLEQRAGRILFNGWPTGVEVGHAMVHGGPFPSTSDSRTTSVGTLAIERFLRPVAYQDVPPALLPRAVADGNPDGIWRRVDGELGKH